jgi:hypothetical protein
VLHLEADSGVTESGGTVVFWDDQSPSANHLSAAGDPMLVQAALNGNPVLSFDGGGDRLERLSAIAGLPAGAGDRSVFLVVNYFSTGIGGFSYGERGCNKTFGVIVDPAGDLMLQGWCTAYDHHSTVAGSGAGWLTQAVILESNQWIHYADGLVIDSGTQAFNTAVSRIVVGAEIDNSPHVDMDMAAILVYDRALSESERLQVEAALASKYFGSTPTATATATATPTELLTCLVSSDQSILENGLFCARR